MHVSIAELLNYIQSHLDCASVQKRETCSLGSEDMYIEFHIKSVSLMKEFFIQL